VFGLVDESKKKNLGIAAGTQRRHQKHYLEGIKRIKDGEIGEVVGGRCWWNQGILWARERMPKMSDAAYQIHNWYNFVWSCGDHIVEQHVHNIDVLNWVLGGPPVAAVGMGFKTRTDPVDPTKPNELFHNIYDFFAINFEYANGVQGISQCRHITGTWTKNAEELRGTKGLALLSGAGKVCTINGKPVFSKEELDSHTDPYVQEHTDLIESIRKGQPINELNQVAESTLTAIIGRMSAYTGQRVEFKWAKETSKENLFPEKLTWESSLPEPALPIPGKYKLV